ncbi:MAG TPA: hypothetical protein VD993_08485 [Chitinophagaceae bacterium]|nr:hypothetical protein [Chitinophagaceae bacterium]
MSWMSSVIALTLLLFSCKADGDGISNHGRPATVTDERLIPYSDSGLQALNDAELLKALSQLIGLPDISGGYNGTYVRAWIWDYDTKCVVNISDDGKIRQCHILDIASRRTDDKDYIVIKKEWTGLQPESGWENFFNEMESRGILLMPAGTYKGELADMTGGWYCEFEVAQGKRYTFFEYFEPDLHRRLHKASRNIHEFLQLINTEMKVQVYSPDEPFKD